jgi:8-hydroxy-5-deazaflavin:NADPH oxidoreductase
VADARGPEVVPAGVLESGARAATVATAVQDKDVVVLSIPFDRVPELADLFATVPAETVVIDTSNYYPHLNGRIEAVDNGQVESPWSAEQLGRPVVKAWNAALAGTQQTKGVPAGTPGRIAIPVAADHDEARRVAMQLVDDTGFDPTNSLGRIWNGMPSLTAPRRSNRTSLDTDRRPNATYGSEGLGFESLQARNTKIASDLRKRKVGGFLRS